VAASVKRLPGSAVQQTALPQIFLKHESWLDAVIQWLLGSCRSLLRPP
jgi:hypothetical protein